MIGNGFDLHYGLPTAYTSFLQVVEFLRKRHDAKMDLTSVAQVFRSIVKIDGADWAICNCYSLYKDEYDAPLGEEVKSLASFARNNFWFSYLKESHRTHPKWVDFEREIAQVLQTLANCFDKVDNSHGPTIEIKTDNKKDIYFLKRLSFLFSKHSITSDGVGHFFVKDNYVMPEPQGSDNYIVNWGAISDDLFVSLKDLSTMLSFYLNSFVVNPLENIIGQKVIRRDKHLCQYGNPNSDSASWKTTVVSFNYTKTWELLYPDSISYGYLPSYVHGVLSPDTEKNIVLGVNSDNADRFGSIDTTFLQFKNIINVSYTTQLSLVVKKLIGYQ